MSPTRFSFFFNFTHGHLIRRGDSFRLGEWNAIWHIDTNRTKPPDKLGLSSLSRAWCSDVMSCLAKKRIIASWKVEKKTLTHTHTHPRLGTDLTGSRIRIIFQIPRGCFILSNSYSYSISLWIQITSRVHVRLFVLLKNYACDLVNRSRTLLA